MTSEGDVDMSSVKLLQNGYPIQQKKPHLHYTISGRTRSDHVGNRIKDFACNLCEKRFARPNSLSQHVAFFHTGELQVQCEICLKMLSSKGAIAKHMLSHKPKSEWPYKCPFCTRRFQAKSDIPKHFLTAAHRDDPRIPKYLSNEWFELFKNCKAPPETDTAMKPVDGSTNTHNVMNIKVESGHCKEEVVSVKVEPIFELSESSHTEVFTLQPSSSSWTSANPMAQMLPNPANQIISNISSPNSGNNCQNSSGEKKYYIVPPLIKYMKEAGVLNPLNIQPPTPNQEAMTSGSSFQIPQNTFIILSNPTVFSPISDGPQESIPTFYPQNVNFVQNVQGGFVNADNSPCGMIKIEIVDPYRIG